MVWTGAPRPSVPARVCKQTKIGWRSVHFIAAEVKCWIRKHLPHLAKQLLQHGVRAVVGRIKRGTFLADTPGPAPVCCFDRLRARGHNVGVTDTPGCSVAYESDATVKSERASA